MNEINDISDDTNDTKMLKLINKEQNRNDKNSVKEEKKEKKYKKKQRTIKEENEDNEENEEKDPKKLRKTKTDKINMKSKNGLLESKDTLRSNKYSLEGGKKPFSIYTRRVMNVSKIGDYLNKNSAKGQCGSYNLGNTCFMNSSIACISNCTELTYYFLKGDYLKDINKKNKLGMQGELAESWGKLLKEYWVEETRVGDPKDFKNTICSKATIFKGNHQHDSNEFMSIFLDYLNEDLNKATKSEYIEIKEKQKNETDEECAKRFWECNLKRNDSIITDLFFGQFKSTITCVSCGYINITFDPFDTINLPMSNKNKKEIMDEFKIFYVPKYCIRDTICLKLKNIDKYEMMDNIIGRIKKEKNFIYYDKINKLSIVDVYRKKKFSFIQKNEKIKEYSLEDEKVVLFDTLEEDVKLTVYFFENDKDDSKCDYPRIIFGKKDMTLDNIRKEIYFNIRKNILSPLLKENERKDALSLEIEKYIKDKHLKLNDKKLLDLIEKEYKIVFSGREQDEEIEERIYNFRRDMPFEIFLEKSQGNQIIFLNKKYFKKLSPELKEISKLNSFNDNIKDIFKKIEDINIYVKFNDTSNYINKDAFDLNYYDEISLEYDSKKEKAKAKEDTESEDNENLTLEKCFKKFTKEELLGDGDEWYCSKCKKHVKAIKKIELYYLPKILIICLKRFIKETTYKWGKNRDNVEFPIKNMDMKNLMIGPDRNHSIYDLFAVSQHSGSAGFGHYTAVCKNDGKWFLYNDSSCTETNANSCQNAEAYVLFYRRQTD